MKIFSEEIKILFDRLKSKKPFAFSKYADGEWMAMRGINANPGNGEWVINGTEYSNSIEMLINSFKYQDDGYYVGISCPCCQGEAFHDMKLFSGQREDHLTFANIFVNSNYKYYVDNFIPYFSNQDGIYLVANKVTDINKLPFKVEKFYPIDYNAWVVNKNLIDDIKNDISDVSDKLFLFSGGPFGNILAHQLWQFNKKNQYIDVGSTLDPWTKSNRLDGKYYSVEQNDRRVCIWG